MKKRKYTEKEFRQAVKENKSIASTLTQLGLKPAGGNYRIFHNTIKELDVDISHFTGKGHLKGRTHDWGKKIPLNQILVQGSTYQSYKLKQRLYKSNLLKKQCSECGLTKWKNKEISMHLDHINGVNDDNRLENLRLLCPNCHSQTTTYCGKNKRKK